MFRTLRSLSLAGVLAVASLSLGAVGTVSAHSDGCHTWHACPWDPDARTADGRPVAEYTCGDLGYNYWCDVPVTYDDTGHRIFIQPNTTLVDFQPPSAPLTPATDAPPPAPPRANPAGVLPPIVPPSPPIQLDCSKDKLPADTRVALSTTPNDPRIEQGCLTPITAPPQHP